MRRLPVILAGFWLLAVVFAVASWAGNTVVVGGSGTGTSVSTLNRYQEARAPVDGTDQCNNAELWFDTSTDKAWYCENGATDDWTLLTN